MEQLLITDSEKTTCTASNKFDKSLFSTLSEKEQVDFLKKISSVKGNEHVIFFDSIVSGSYPEKVRKEAASAMGRRRDIDIARNQLIKYLKDDNPEICLQAIRGLLVFKDDESIKDKIYEIYNTSANEIIKYVISKEFNLKTLDFDTKQSHIYVDPRYKNKIVNGDTLSILKKIDKNSFHLTFTSPPYYNAKDYSIYQSYDEYLSFLSDVFKEVHRTTKDGRFLIVNTSPVIVPRVGRKYSSKRYPIPYDLHYVLSKNGWDFIDDIHWVKPDASVKNRIGGFFQFRNPLMYKPNAVTEQVMVYRKKSNRLIDWSIHAYNKDVTEKSKVNDDFENNNIWSIDPTFDKTHSAVFPYKLCENIVKYYSFYGDLVFDPFAGSGTLAQAALDLGRNVFMTEINEKYFTRIMEKTINYEVDFLVENDFGGTL